MLRSTILGKDQSGGSPLSPHNSHLLMWLAEIHPRLKKEVHRKEGEQKTDRDEVGKEERLTKRPREKETEKQRWREM